MIRVAFLSAIMALVVGAGLILIPAAVMIVNDIRPSLCGRSCLDPGVTENPDIVLIGGKS